MSFAVGSLVRARGREWVVLPDSDAEMLILRPLGGTEDEVAGVYLPLEPVEPASFELPDPEDVGDHRSSRMLRDAVRLGFRSSAGPFRSFAQIAVEPRPYQLVPLLMGLQLDPVRMLIADDVGIGKTIEAGLLARELLDRAEIQRLAVLCPPHLAEQWQSELLDKFHIDAELVLPGTVTRLERNTGVGESIFEIYPYTVVSLDFIKTDRRRDEFLRSCPEFIIVDEAHTCAWSGDQRGGRHQRHELVKGLATDPERHIALLTATPHSGNEAAFRSLLSILNPKFDELPDDLTGRENEGRRREIARHFVQRRRGDIRAYLNEETSFPNRREEESYYELSQPYKRLFDTVLDYARETVLDPEENRHRQRVRWWSALALLRSLASSPAAAASTLRNRAATVDTETPEEADEVGRRTVLDLEDDDSDNYGDVAPGAQIDEAAGDAQQRHRERLLRMARNAEQLEGDDDQKMIQAVKYVQDLIKDGFSPIVFCRFIPTANYLAEQLRERLPRTVEVVSVTGTLPPAEREARVLAMGDHEKRVLVCTDCLSEGINLQQHFDAVIHYDLSWNPTRHEQREGRVDRFGQDAPEVRVITYYGVDNQIDGVVLDVLLRKHKSIRTSLGISVPVPGDTNQVVEAIFEGLLLREQSSSAGTAQYLPGFEEMLSPQAQQLLIDWDDAAEREERRSQTMFAQARIDVDDVSRELAAVRAAIGSHVDVERFVRESVQMLGGVASGDNPIDIDVGEARSAIRELADRVFEKRQIRAGFQLPVPDGVVFLDRTHPFVEGLATYVMDTALDPVEDGVATRTGAIRTSAVSTLTTLLLVRNRFHIVSGRGDEERTLLAEDVQLLAFEGVPASASWLESSQADELLNAQPTGNIAPGQASGFIQRILDGFEHVEAHLEDIAHQRGADLLDAHRRVRQATRARYGDLRVEPNLPPDVLGIYVLLPG